MPSDNRGNSPRNFITVLLAGAVIVFSGCAHRQPDVSAFTARQRQTSVAFGTVSVLRLYEDFTQQRNNARFERVWSETVDILRELNAVFSPIVPDSDVVRFNNLAYGESISISHHTASVIKIAKEAHAELGGLFDPTVFPLVDLWGFTPRFRTNRFIPLFPYDRPQGRALLPPPEYIEAFARLVNFDGVILSGCDITGFRLTKMIPPVVVNGVTYNAGLDFGAIVKGYAVDLVREIMLREGFLFGYFSSGGSSITFLNGMDHVSHENGIFNFQLRLRKPRPGQNHDSAFMTLMTSGLSLSTSGDSDNFFFADGIRYSHTIDPRTGRPVNTGAQSGIISATVLGVSGAFTEALSTALLIMTLPAAVDLINRLQDHKVVLVYYKPGRDYYEVITNIPAELITILDPAYILINL